jgi:hypothetical protein
MQYRDEKRRLWSGSMLVLLTESSFVREKELQREALEQRSERETMLTIINEDATVILY